MRITIELNDREAAKVNVVKSVLKCSTQEAVSLIIAACKRRAIESALQMFKLPEDEPEVVVPDEAEEEPLELD